MVQTLNNATMGEVVTNFSTKEWEQIYSFLAENTNATDTIGEVAFMVASSMPFMTKNGLPVRLSHQLKEDFLEVIERHTERQLLLFD
jgi:hypothetical protein